MGRRALAGLWLFVGFVVWNGFLDIYVSRGAREYGQKQAEADLGLAPHVSMAAVMHNATADGVEAGSFWALGIVTCGLATVWRAEGRGQRSEGEGQRADGASSPVAGSRKRERDT